MRKRNTSLSLIVLFLTLSALAASKPASHKATNGGPAPDSAYMQKILDAWSTLDTSKVAPYYAQGEHTFYDIAPVKYTSWDDYAKGVVQVAADFQTVAFTLNDDAVVHPHGDLYWGTGTVKGDILHKSGKREMATYRWTVIWEKQNGKWVIVHDHFSAPEQ